MVTSETFLDEESFEDLSDYAPGEIVAERYELISPLGTGGMGVVWRAEDLVLRRTVALKLVRADRAHPLLGKRLLTEARAAAAVDHPCVVDILDLGTTDDDDTYLVMELLDGAELDERLDHGPVQPVAAVSIVAALADALCAAHAAGVVHRDIKATNVFMVRSPEGSLRPVLIDFGIARLVDASEDVRLTVTGNLLGTPTYMSPEQAGGSRHVDHRTDLWSLCVLLYELITGAPPFDGENYNEVLKRILMDDPIPFGIQEEDDGELWSIVHTGLHKDLDQRWQSAQALLRALDAWLVRRGQAHDITGRSLSPLPAVMTAPSERPPSARPARLDSIEPTVVGVPALAPSATLRRLRNQLTSRPSAVAALGMVAGAAAIIVAMSTTATPATPTTASARWSSAVGSVGALPATTTPDHPSTTTPEATPVATPTATPTAVALEPAVPEPVHADEDDRNEKASQAEPRATPRLRATTSLGLPLPSQPNF